MHCIEFVVEPATFRPKANLTYVYDGNATLQNITLVPDTFKELAEYVFNNLPKNGQVDFTKKHLSSHLNLKRVAHQHYYHLVLKQKL